MADGDVHHTVQDCLGEARKATGSASLRSIAAQTEYSHTTVAKAFTADAATLSWPIIEQVAAAVHADRGTVLALWATAHDSGQPDEAAPAGAVEQRLSPEGQGLPTILGLVGLFGTGIALAVMQAVDADTTRTALVTDLVQFIFAAAAAAVFAVRARRAATSDDRLNTRFYGLLAVGTLGWAGGQILWMIERHIAHQAIPRGYLHDIGFLTMSICLVAALWLRALHYGVASLQRSRRTVVTFIGILALPYTLVIMLLSALQLHTSGMVLLYAIYPACDLALAMMALAPMICGRRIVVSAILTTGLLAAAASDLGYLLLRADPTFTKPIPPSAALGFMTFTMLLLLYAIVGRPLPVPPKAPVTARVGWFRSRDIVTTGTSITTGLALVAATTAMWMTSATDTRIVLLAITTIIAAALAISSADTQRASSTT